MDAVERNIIASYMLQHRLGRDGAIEIYLARSLTSGEQVTISLLPEPVAANRAIFEAGMEQAASLNHPCLLPLLDYGITDSRTYTVRPFMPGGSLEQRIRVAAPLPLREVVDRVARVAKALDYLHSKGFIHFGIKPDILLRDRFDQTFVSDFGGASVCFQVVGLPVTMMPYTAPEVLLRVPCTPAVDVYALGMITYQMLAGGLPPESVTRTQWMRAHLNQAHSAVGQAIQGLPPAVQAVLEKAIAKLSNARYNSAGEMAIALADAADYDLSTSLPDALWYAARSQQPRSFFEYRVPAFKVGYGDTDTGTLRAGVENPSRLYVDALMREHEDPQEAMQLYRRFIMLRPNLAQGDAIERLYRIEQDLGALEATQKLSFAEQEATAGRWLDAERMAREILAYAPNHTAASALLEHASRRATVDLHYQHALAAWEAGYTNTAVTLLSELFQFDPGFYDPHGIATITAVSAPYVVERVHLYAHDDRQVLCLAVSPDGSLLAAGSTERTLDVWSLDRLGQPVSTQEHAGWVCQVAFSPDGSLLLSASWDGEIKLWNNPDITYSGVIAGLASQVRAMAFAKHDPSLLATSSGYFLNLWHMPEGKRGQIIREEDRHPITALAFANQPFMICGVYNGEVRIRDAASQGWPLIMQIPAHDGPVYSVACSPDDRLIACGSRDGSLCLIETATGQILHYLSGHRDAVYGVAFSPDGSVLASASRDSYLRLWQVADGALLNTLKAYPRGVRSLTFTPDGRSLLTGGEEGGVKIWRII